MYTLGLDTIEGAKLLQLKFGSFGAFQPDQAVMHEGRRARFIRISDGAAIIRHCGGSHNVTVPLDALSLPTDEQVDPALARRTGGSAGRPRIRVRAEMERRPRRHPHRRPLLRP
jgi:hypothetical protein